MSQPVKNFKSGKRSKVVAQTTVQSPFAPNRGTSAYIPGLGFGYGIGSPFLQIQSPLPPATKIF